MDNRGRRVAKRTAAGTATDGRRDSQASRANPGSKDSKGSQDNKGSRDRRDSRASTVSNGTRDSSAVRVRTPMRQQRPTATAHGHRANRASVRMASTAGGRADMAGPGPRAPAAKARGRAADPVRNGLIP